MSNQRLVGRTAVKVWVVLLCMEHAAVAAVTAVTQPDAPSQASWRRSSAQKSFTLFHCCDFRVLSLGSFFLPQRQFHSRQGGGACTARDRLSRPSPVPFGAARSFAELRSFCMDVTTRGGWRAPGRRDPRRDGVLSHTLLLRRCRSTSGTTSARCGTATGTLHEDQFRNQASNSGTQFPGTAEIQESIFTTPGQPILEPKQYDSGTESCA